MSSPNIEVVAWWVFFCYKDKLIMEHDAVCDKHDNLDYKINEIVISRVSINGT